MTEPTNTAEREAPIFGPRVDSLRDWASIWFDLLRIQQFLVARDELPAITDHGPDLFTRNALWDAAVAAYWRCNNSGNRPRVEGLDAKLPAQLGGCHARLKASRHTQVAHHEQPRDTRTTATVVFDDAGEALGTRVRVFPAIGDDDEPLFKTLVGQLASSVSEKIDKLASQSLADQDLEQLRAIATAHDDAAGGPYGRVRVTCSSWLPE